MENVKKLEKRHGLIYDMYGIFIDYLIDTNRFKAINGPVYNYENFQTWRKWEVAKIEIEGKPYLIADIKILSFSYCRYIRHKKRILKYGLNSKEVIEELKAYSKFLGIPILDQLEFYLRGNSKAMREI